MLEHIVVDATVRALRPGFAVPLIMAEGLVNGPQSLDSLDRLAEAGAELAARRLRRITPDGTIATRLVAP